MPEIIGLYAIEKVKSVICNDINFLPNYAIDRALLLFPALKKEDLKSYISCKYKIYHT